MFKNKGLKTFVHLFSTQGLQVVYKQILCFNSIDATEEPESDSILPKLGRLVNHGMPKQRNARMKILDGPALALYATRHIFVGEQILYDYGVKVPWMTRFVSHL